MLLTQDLTHLDVPAAPAGVDYPDPRWWLWQLEGELALRYPLVRLQQDYYEGRHRLAFATSTFRDVFGEMLAAVSDNWMPTVVNASKERLRVQGFRFPDGTTSPAPRRRGPLSLLRRPVPADQGLDRHAWDIWQRNGLDVGSGIGFREAIVHAEGYLLAWWDDEDDRRARITVEHPAQVVVRYVAGDPQRRAAALKKWQEDDETLRATLYLPDRVYRYRRKEGATRWEQLPGADGEFANTLGVVPVVPLINDPHLLPVRPPSGLWIGDGEDAKGQDRGTPISQYAHVGLGRSDIVDLVSTQDSINKLVCDMLVASEVGAFRQRWATGLEVPEDDNGQPVELFKAAIERVWSSPDPEARFGTFEATDLRNFTVALEQRVQSLSSRSRTPPHYLLGMSGSFPSGESLKATETGLVSKVRDKQTWFGEGIEEAIRLALQIERATAATSHRAETAWENPESRSEAEFIDAQVKKLAIGVPPQQIWQDAGYSPEQIGRFRDMLVEYAEYTAVRDALNPAPALDPAAAAGGQHAGGGPQPAQ